MMFKKILASLTCGAALLLSSPATAQTLDWSPASTITEVTVMGSKVRFKISPYASALKGGTCSGRLELFDTTGGMNYHHMVGALLSAYSNGKTVSVLYDSSAGCGWFDIYEVKVQ